MMNPPTPPPKSPTPAGGRPGLGWGPRSPGVGVGGGYKRSASVTAAVDFFESKSRSTSTNDIHSRSSSPRASAPSTRSVSAASSPSSTPGPGSGPSSRHAASSPRPRPAPRTTPTGTIRNAQSPRSRGDDTASTSTRTSIDSTASNGTSGEKIPVGLGMRGVTSISPGRELRRTSEGSPLVLGGRRVSDTAATAGPSRKVSTPRPSLPSSSLSSPPTRPPATIRRASDQATSSQPVRPTRTTPKAASSSKLQPSPLAPSPKSGSPRNITSPRTLSSPRTNPSPRPAQTSPRTPSSISRMPKTMTPRALIPTSPHTPPRLRPTNQPQRTPRTTPAPDISVSHPTPDRFGSPSRAKRPPDPGISFEPTESASDTVGDLPDRSPSAGASAPMEQSTSARSSRSSLGSSRHHHNDDEALMLDSDDEKARTISPRKPRGSQPPLEIPPRRSSAASMELSPTNSISGFATPPLISPRKSSKSSLKSVDEPVELPTRRASRSVMLGNVYEQGYVNGNGPPLPSQPTSSLMTASASTSPRPDRKSPGLTIETPILPFARNVARPSPPIPAKSPLRASSRQSSATYIAPLSATDSMKSAADTDSITAVAGTPVTPAETLPVRPDRRASTVTMTAESDETDVTVQAMETLKPGPRKLPDEIRFTAFTTGSVYSQDSAPASAIEAERSPSLLGAEMENGDVSGKSGRRRSRMDDLWGRTRDSRASLDGHESTDQPLRIVPPNSIHHVTTDSPATATTTHTASSAVASDISNNASMGHSPLPLTPTNDQPAPPRPVRSPSAPVLKLRPTTPLKAAKLLGIDRPPPRSGTEPTPLLPSAMTRSPTAPTLTPRTPSTASKRSHLIKEIAMTERAYATDLALVRDAYLSRYLRPASMSSGDSTFAGSRRGSTTPASEGKRLSGADWMSITSPTTLAKSPGEMPNGPYGYFTPMTASASTSTMTNSVTSFSVPSPNGPAARGPTTSGNAVTMGPPVGKPLTPSDLKAVFLNIDQLTAGADELATAFEQAMGDDEQIHGGREGEVGADRLGEVFTTLIPRLRPIYHYYCARQQTASQRLQEIFQDTAHANNLNESWSRIKHQTHAWNLDSMLIKPVQRITKYPLLFDDLLNCTTPVHPDYFNIRNAAELAKSIAIEIDEAKRRKDVVASALNKKPPGPSPSKPSGKGLKMFRKDKGNSTTTLPKSLSSSSMIALSQMDALPEISRNSLIALKALEERVDEAEQVVRRVGREVVLWTAAAKEALITEDGVIATWLRVVRLDENDGPSDRMDAFRGTIRKVVGEVWTSLNDEVKDSIMPIFAKLLDASNNPRKVIQKRESKSSDYNRYLQLVKAKRNIDKSLSASAADFYALHTQLIDELPAFLEGYTRILDLALVAFAGAQTRYHLGVKSTLDEFAQRWIARPRTSPKARVDGSLLEEEGEVDLGSGRGIVKAWHHAWVPYADAMDHFQCTRPARAVASRLASFNNRPGSRTASRPSSPAPALHHSSSFTSRSPSSNSLVSPRETMNRTRSTSLLGPAPTIVSPAKESTGRFGVQLLRGNKAPKPHASPRASRPNSLHIPTENTNRYSFGLPKIPSEANFEGLGLSPTKSITASNRATSDPTRYDGSPVKPRGPSGEERVGLGLGEIRKPSLGEASQSKPSRSSSRSPDKGISTKPFPPSPTLASRVVSQSSVISQSTAVSIDEHDRDRRSRKVDYAVDASEGWRNEPVLYQCACVAEFDPRAVGDRKYRGLKFLPMAAGDLFEIFHEVGRIDELPSFPYPEIGVDNDGVLVGRGEDGGIGLLICSFLEPLRE